ncbi:MAG: hypothetical protein MZV63_68920 [Marinilabiliales bacterium]|nr:hypothetical protein [Marinilabiliales bacterium]
MKTPGSSPLSSPVVVYISFSASSAKRNSVTNLTESVLPAAEVPVIECIAVIGRLALRLLTVTLASFLSRSL